MSEEGRVVHHHHESNQPSYDDAPPPPPPVVPHYGTFQGVPSSPAMGFPQPAPPPGSMNPPPEYYARAYQAVPGFELDRRSDVRGLTSSKCNSQFIRECCGYAVADGTPVRDHRQYHHRLPCCGIGFGWFLFIIGFFMAGFPWYFAAIILLCCSRTVDPREKPAYVCCTVASVLAIIATVFGVSRLSD